MTQTNTGIVSPYLIH